MNSSSMDAEPFGGIGPLLPTIPNAGSPVMTALKKTVASKEYLYSVLKKEGYDYVPSSANFVLFPIKMDGKQFADEMMKRSVGVRFWKFNNKDWCRVSVGRMDEMEAFAAAFKELS